MRKTLLTICAAVFALVAVSSCGKIWDEFDNVHGQLDSIEARLDSLENAINGQVATINSTLGALQTEDDALAAAIAEVVADVKKANELIAKLDAADGTINGRIDDLEKALEAFQTEAEKQLAEAVAKIAVVKAEKNTAGNYLLTFADGSTLEVAAADANANNTGLVTVVDGKWAVVGADGKTTVLDALVHPDTVLEFKVDPETKELLYTLDGETWEKTGAYVADDSYYLVTDFVDGDTFVTITVGGVEYQLPKVSTNRFEILSGMVFFEAGATKTIPVLLDGVVSSMVAKIPGGWSAEIVDGALQVTAPAEDSGSTDDAFGDDMGVMPMSTGVGVTETYGTVEIWAVTESGKTFVGTLEVSVSDAFATIVVKNDEVIVTIPSEEVMEWDENWNLVPTGVYEPVYYPVFYGACEADKFDGEALMEKLSYFGIGEDEAANPTIRGNYKLNEMGYPEWLAETKASIKDLLGAEPELGKSYVIWAFDRNAYEYENSDATFVKVYYTPSKVNFGEVTATWNDATINVSIEGLESFYLQILEKEQYEAYTDADIDGSWTDEIIDMYSSYGMDITFWDMYMPGMLHFCPGDFYEGSYSGPISKLGVGEDDADTIEEFTPGAELVLCVLPIDPAKSKADYRLSDVIFKDLELEGLAYNGTAAVAFGDPEVGYTDFTLPMTSTGAAVTVYDYMPTEAYTALIEGLEDGDTIEDYMIENFRYCYQSKEAEYEVYAQSLTKGVKYTVFAMAVDADGKCSKVVTKEVTTNDYPYDDTEIKVEVVSVEFTEGAAPVTVTYKVTGANAFVVNASFGTPSLLSNATSGARVEGFLMNNGPEYYYLKNYEVGADGTASVTYKSYSTYNKYSYAVAYTVNEDGDITALTHAVATDLSTYLPAAE